MASVQVLAGSRIGTRYDVAEQTLVGRSACCGVLLPERTVSRNHARIVRGEHGYVLEDLGSQNGTYINGRRVQGRRALRDRDRIHFSNVSVLFLDSHSSMERSVRLPHSGGLVGGPEEPTDTISEHSLLEGGAREVHSMDVDSGARLRAVLEIVRSLGRSLQLEDLQLRILNSLFEVFPQAQHGHIYLADDPAGELIVQAKHPGLQASDLDEDPAPDALHLGDRNIAAKVMAGQTAILVADEVAEIDDPPGPDDALDGPAPETRRRSVMCAPLLGPSQVPLGVIQLETSDADRPFDRDDLEVLLSAAVVAGQAVEHAREHQARLRLEHRERELTMAKDVQLRLLPRREPQVPGYRFYQYYRAAEEVGGDYFGYINLPGGRLAIALADVAGKGVAAALLMAQLCSEVRYCLETTATPAEAVDRLNKDLAALDERMVTFVLCVLDPVRNVLSIVNAGHMPPLRRLANNGAVEQLGLEQVGLPLGVDPGREYVACQIALAPGDKVLLYTDGISEALDAKNHPYGTSWIADILALDAPQVDELGQALLGDVTAFMSGRPQNDDICLICFARAPE